MIKQKEFHTINNYLKRIGGISIILLLFLSAAAQDAEQYAFLIQFKDKEPLKDTSALLSEKAWMRRAKFNIALNPDDYPVNQNYIQTVLQDSNIHLRYTLKWKNGIVVNSALENLNYLNTHSFIANIHYVGKTNTKKVEGMRIAPIFNYAKDSKISTSNLNSADYNASYDQLRQIRIPLMHKRGYDGEGVSIGVFDAGFMNLNVLPSYTRLRAQNKLYSGYDLVDLDNEVTDSDNHGTAVSSCISAYEPGKYIGGAPNATVFLFRTENGKSEYLIEELNWCKAAEIADSIGLDMVTSSLGYTKFDDESMNHTYAELDGKSTFVAIAAQQLADRGVIVINSAGNEGDDAWKKIGSPGDAVDVLTIGAVDENSEISGFSSRGLNNNMVKPDLCAKGVRASVSSTFGSYYQGYGTSYATPIFSGGVACLLQAHPNTEPSEIRRALRQSGRNNYYPDTNYGYGVANIYAAHLLLSDSSMQPSVWELIKGKDMLIYNGEYTEVDIKIKTKRSFLFIFNILKTEKQYKYFTDLPVYYLNLSSTGLDCTKNYTIKLKFKNSVDNHRLKYKDLQLCAP